MANKYKRYEDEYDKTASSSYENYQGLLDKNQSNYQNSVDRATTQYNNSNASIEANRQTTIQNNAIMQEKLNKYLGNYMKSQGISGGLSETYAANAYANANNAATQANLDAQNQKDTAYEQYSNALDTAERTMTEKEEALGDRYRSMSKEDGETALANLQTDIGNIDPNLEGDEYYSEVDRIWNQYKNELGDNYTTGQNMINGVVDTLNKQYRDQEQGITTNEKGELSSITLKNGDAVSTTGSGINLSEVNTPASLNDAAGKPAYTGNQKDYLNALIKDISKWDETKNGTVVSLIYGWNGGNKLYTYYDGKLYQIDDDQTERKWYTYQPNGYGLGESGNIRTLKADKNIHEEHSQQRGEAYSKKNAR